MTSGFWWDSAERRTDGGPETLRGFHQQILQQTGVPVTEQLGSNQREDRQASILEIRCVNDGLRMITGIAFLTSLLL